MKTDDPALDPTRQLLPAELSTLAALPDWTWKEAAEAISGLTPRDPSKFDKYLFTGGELAIVYRLIKGAVTNGQLPSYVIGGLDPRVKPAEAIAWAIAIGRNVAPCMRILETKNVEREPPPLQTKERTTLLVLIGLLAKEAGIDLQMRQCAARGSVGGPHWALSAGRRGKRRA